MARHIDKVRAWSDMNGNVRPVKCDANKRRVRIDGVVAAVMAIGRVLLVQESRSVYETRGVREVVFRGY